MLFPASSTSRGLRTAAGCSRRPRDAAITRPWPAGRCSLQIACSQPHVPWCILRQQASFMHAVGSSKFDSAEAPMHCSVFVRSRGGIINRTCTLWLIIAQVIHFRSDRITFLIGEAARWAEPRGIVSSNKRLHRLGVARVGYEQMCMREHGVCQQCSKTYFSILYSST
jgi:hypothetical protein